MKLCVFQEPELEFGIAGRHIDVRHGIKLFGPLDVGDTRAPTRLRVGIVGTDETITAVRQWLDRCKSGVDAKATRLSNLFPAFPGFTEDVAFRAVLVFHDRWCSSIRQREIDGIIQRSQGEDTVRESVAMFVDHAQDLVQQGGPMVLICAPPRDLLAAVDERTHVAREAEDTEIDESSEAGSVYRPLAISFHDLLKAEGMRLAVPLQMIRPGTYRGRRQGGRDGRGNVGTSPLQDEATRAWNFHTALYYKAGGIPWRVVRDASELTTCVVGVSFYRTLDRTRVLTSVAQVFNERGEGIIVRGGEAQVDKDDRTPQLATSDAHGLLKEAIRVYRKEHGTSPARVVVHKTSRVTAAEADGFDAAATDHSIDVVELLTVRRSLTRLFRHGTYPPLRGTFLEMERSEGLLYLKGSVTFFETYPGMYVPRPLEFSLFRGEGPLERHAREMLILSKLNWNNTQFDGGEPITLRAARRVGDILKCATEGREMQHTFRFFM